MNCKVCGQKELFPKKVNSTYRGESICPTCLTQRSHKCHLCGKIERDVEVLDFKSREKNKWTSYKRHDLCPSCWSARLKTCNNCGDTFISDIDGWGSMHLCEECGPFNVVKDAVTGEHMEKSLAIWIQDGPFKVPVSRRTASNSEFVQECMHCHTSHIVKDRKFKNTDPATLICDTCFPKITNCELCGETYFKGDSSKSFKLDLSDAFVKSEFNRTTEESDRVCSRCWEESIAGYHSNHSGDLTFYEIKGGRSREISKPFGSTGGLTRYMGFELEVDAPGVPPNQVRACAVRVQEHLGSSLISITRDGSISNGFEIISAPATLEWYQKSWHKTYQPMTAILRRYGMRSHDPGTCGLHIHVNRLSIGNGDDLLKWFTWFAPEITIFSRRRNVGYCAPMLWKQRHVYNFSEYKQIYIPSGGHGVALNYNNNATIEFRIFRGTINQRTLLATLQFVDGFVQFVNKHKIDDLPTTKWEDIVGSINKEAFQEHCKGFDFHKYDSLFVRNSETFQSFNLVDKIGNESETKEAL